MIKVTESIEIAEETIELRTIYASGPGGQHVNKTRSAVQLRFDIMEAYGLPQAVQRRIIELGGARVNSEYQLVITARRHRSQERNRREALARLLDLVRKAAQEPRPRLRKPRCAVAHAAREHKKRIRSETKRRRRPVVVCRYEQET